MRFKKESERRLHPQAGLIPKSLWGHYTYWTESDLFNSELTESQLVLMQTPLSTLLSNQELITSEEKKKAAWACIAIGHPDESPSVLMQLAELLGLSSHQILFISSAIGNLPLVERCLSTVSQAEAQKMIKENSYHAYCEATIHGHLDVLKFFEGKALLLTGEIIQANILYVLSGIYYVLNLLYYALNWTISPKERELGLKELEPEAPLIVEDMIKASSYGYYCFALAAANNHLPILRHFEELKPHLLEDMIKYHVSSPYAAFSDAAGNGHVAVLEYLEEKAPQLVDEMIESGKKGAFNQAATLGHVAVLRNVAGLRNLGSLKSYLTSDSCYGSSIYSYSEFQISIHCGNLALLQYFYEKEPSHCDQWIKAYDYQLFRDASEHANLLQITQFLLNHPGCLAYAEMHEREYSAHTHPFIENKLVELKIKKQAFETRNANGIFDLTAPNEITSCFYMIRNLIRRNDRALDESLQFLLTIPAVNALVHTEVTANQSNELIRLAMSTNNVDVANMLLNIPAVAQLAEQHDFYRDEGNGRLDLRALAQDRESSMTALTTGEKKRLNAAINRYQPMINQVGVASLMESLCCQLLDRYQKNPAKIISNDTQVILPPTWAEFIALNLTNEMEEQGLIAYRQHKDHTAWRYLLKPNPWMADGASYVHANPDNACERWATFEEYQSVIVLLWLASMDVKIQPTNGHSLESRLNHFIDELAYIGRAHNWDKTRHKKDGQTEEYDDLLGDKPSCYSGMKRRLFQSVIGHPLLNVLTFDEIKMALRDFIRNHFETRITDENRAGLKEAFDDYFITGIFNEQENPLKKLDISEAEQQQFIVALETKYGEQFTEEPRFKQHIACQFRLLDHGRHSEYAHALKFEALVGLFALLNKVTLIPAKVSQLGLFASEEKEEPLGCCAAGHFIGPELK